MSVSLRLSVLPLALAAALTAACGRATADDYVRKADAYANASRLPEAIIEFRRAIQADPTRGDIRLKLADVYARVNDRVDALNETVRAADLLPRDVVAQLKAGNLRLVAGDFDDAKARAEQVLALDPKNVSAQILLGNALAGLQDLDGAVAEYEQALLLNPAQDAAYVNIGAIRLARGKRTEAEASFRKAVEVSPRSVQARMALVHFLWASGRGPETEQALKDVLQLDSNNISANRALAVFYLTSYRPNEAEAYFKKVADTTKTAVSALTLADYYASTKRFDIARKVLGELEKRDTSAAAAVATHLAALDALEGDRVRALEKVRDVLSKNPSDAAARLLKARLLRADGKRDEALSEAKAIATDESSGAIAGEALLLIGNIQSELGHAEEAIDAYARVMKREPETLSAALALASLHLAMGSLDQASGYAKQALAIREGNLLARVLVVRIALAKNDMPVARAELATLRRDFPDSPMVNNLMGGVQLKDRQVDAARASFAKVAARAPEDLEATAGLVTIDLGIGRAKDALARIETTISRPKPTASMLVLAARTYAAAGNLAKTEELLKRAIDVEPSNLQAYGLLGQFYADHNRMGDATARFRQLVALDPNSVAANTMLGMLLEAERHGTEAEQQYKKVMALDPRAAAAANNLAWIYVASNRNLDEALQLALAAQQQLPEEPHVTDTLGWICYRKEMTSAAVRHLESSVSKDPNVPITHYHLGMAYAQAGNRAKARQELQRALAFGIAFDGADEARNTLSRIGS